MTPSGEGLPQAWRDDLRRTVEVSEERLADRLDRAVAGTDLGPDRDAAVAAGRRRRCSGCWPLVALAGALWLLALVVLGFFQLDDVVPLPRVEGLPLPTLLLVGGLLAGLLLAVVARPAGRAAGAAARRGRPTAGCGPRSTRWREEEVLGADGRRAARTPPGFRAGRWPQARAAAARGPQSRWMLGGPRLGQLVAAAARSLSLAAGGQPRPDVLAAGPLLPAVARSRAGRPGAAPSRRARGRGRPRAPAGGRAPRRSGRAASRPGPATTRARTSPPPWRSALEASSSKTSSSPSRASSVEPEETDGWAIRARRSLRTRETTCIASSCQCQTSPGTEGTGAHGHASLGRLSACPGPSPPPRVGSAGGAGCRARPGPS